MRTRVGYAGGTTPDPEYHNLGDHAETLQVDYDPTLVTYADLLEMFWLSHSPTAPAFSRQYASLILFHDDGQRRLAEASMARLQPRFGKLYTELAPFTEFHMAEDYHQKYRLRSDAVIMHDFRLMYPAGRGFVGSTAAARVNGYLSGMGSPHRLLEEIDRFGLSESARMRLLERVGVREAHVAQGGTS